jgi:hypothetical protein
VIPLHQENEVQNIVINNLIPMADSLQNFRNEAGAIYVPLSSPDSIRILQLHPATEFNDLLEGDFIYRSRIAILRDAYAQSYDAISYVWGEPVFSSMIRLRSRNIDIKITKKVDALLRHLRKETVSRYLWVDAICLNQSDIGEKSVQVPLMGAIYNEARKVRIWFGEATDDTPKLFAFLRTILALERRSGRLSAEIFKTVMNEILGVASSRLIDALLRNPWFQRRWTLQEAFVNPSTFVHCGRHKILWSQFVMALKTFLGDNISILLDLSAEAQLSLNVAICLKETHGTLLENLWNFDHNECFDRRDRIYALYGLYDPKQDSTQSTDLSADYSLDWNEVYEKFAIAQANTSHWYHLLYHVCVFGSLWEANPLWPSWVPNWSGHRKYSAPPRPVGGFLRNPSKRARIGNGGLVIQTPSQNARRVCRTIISLPTHISNQDPAKFVRQIVLDVFHEKFGNLSLSSNLRQVSILDISLRLLEAFAHGVLDPSSRIYSNEASKILGFLQHTYTPVDWSAFGAPSQPYMLTPGLAWIELLGLRDELISPDILSHNDKIECRQASLDILSSHANRYKSVPIKEQREDEALHSFMVSIFWKKIQHILRERTIIQVSRDTGLIPTESPIFSLGPQNTEVGDWIIGNIVLRVQGDVKLPSQGILCKCRFVGCLNPHWESQDPSKLPLSGFEELLLV